MRCCAGKLAHARVFFPHLLSLMEIRDLLHSTAYKIVFKSISMTLWLGDGT